MNGQSILLGGCLFLLSLPSGLADQLHQAASRGDVVQLKRLVATHGDLDARDEAGETALTLAALGGNLHALELLAGAGADIQDRNEGGLTPLHAAAYAGHADVASWLIARGADVNDVQNFYRTSPLHLAAEEGRKDVVELLLAHGARIEATERNGYTPLTQAGWREHWDIADTLLDAGAHCQPADISGDWLFEACTKRR